MKYVFLDGEKILSHTDLHRTFANALDFPAYYGHNLDALHDCLTEQAESVGVIVVHADLLKEHLGRRWKGFFRLMGDLTEEEPGFRFLCEPFEDREEGEETEAD